MNQSPQAEPYTAERLTRGAGLGGVCARSCRRGLHRRLLRLCRSRVAVRSGPSRVRIARHRDFELLAQNVFQFVPNILVFSEEDTRVLAALAHALAAKADPRAALFEHALFNAQIDQVDFARDAFTVDDVEFRFAEGRGDFVLHYFRARTRAD